MARSAYIRPQRKKRCDQEKKITSRSRLSLEADLSRVLTSIAALLISAGYGYGRLSKFARTSFVDAAVTLSQRKGRSPSVAQLAASTGLSRAEVSKILKHRRVLTSENVSRASNVAAGWLSNSEFLDSRRLPRPLPFRGGSRDFSSLAKRFSGDIPAKAMLREMERLKMVTQDSSGAVRLIRPLAEITRDDARAMRAITPWVQLLKESVQDAKAQSLSSTTNHLELNFDSVPQVLAVLRELKKRRNAFVQSISELGPSRQRKRYSLRITIAVAVAKPRQISTTSKMP